MSLEPYGPVAALIALAVLTVIAFASARALMTRTAPTDEPVALDGPTVAPPGSETPSALPAPAPCTPEYVMAASVELWFGETKVAVRAGSQTERRFLGFAAALLEELESARDSV